MSAPFRIIETPEKALFRVENLFLLKSSGAFAGYAKAELIDGTLWGVIRAPNDEAQWDDIVPILLRPIDHELMREQGAFKGCRTRNLVKLSAPTPPVSSENFG
jgi:hypothetical protein